MSGAETLFGRAALLAARRRAEPRLRGRHYRDALLEESQPVAARRHNPYARRQQFDIHGTHTGLPELDAVSGLFRLRGCRPRGGRRRGADQWPQRQRLSRRGGLYRPQRTPRKALYRSRDQLHRPAGHLDRHAGRTADPIQRGVDRGCHDTNRRRRTLRRHAGCGHVDPRARQLDMGVAQEALQHQARHQGRGARHARAQTLVPAGQLHGPHAAAQQDGLLSGLADIARLDAALRVRRADTQRRVHGTVSRGRARQGGQRSRRHNRDDPRRRLRRGADGRLSARTRLPLRQYLAVAHASQRAFRRQVAR